MPSPLRAAELRCRVSLVNAFLQEIQTNKSDTFCLRYAHKCGNVLLKNANLIIKVRTASKVNVIQWSSVDPSAGKYLDQRGRGLNLYTDVQCVFNLALYLCITI